jgi:hypothetical protein
MKITIKWLFFIAIIIGGIYIGIRLCLPTEIIDVHDGRDLIVKNFPVLEANREKWWYKNENYLKNKYNFPRVSYNGSYTVVIIDIDNGYEEEIPERDWLLPGETTDHLYCYNKMNVKNQCIRKDNILMLINKTSAGEIKFYSYSKWR